MAQNPLFVARTHSRPGQIRIVRLHYNGDWLPQLYERRERLVMSPVTFDHSVSHPAAFRSPDALPAVGLGPCG